MKFSPRKLFLIDGLGAILSAFMLGIVLVTLESTFGIPSATLYVLAIFPVFFAIFDFYCFQKNNNSLGRPLKIIAILNLLYCSMSIGCAIYHIDTVTILGWVYICVEVLLIVILSIFELRAANRITIKNNTL